MYMQILWGGALFTQLKLSVWYFQASLREDLNLLRESLLTHFLGKAFHELNTLCENTLALSLF